MSIPPLWKIQREIARVGRQFITMWPRIGTYLFGAAYYDWRYGPKRKTLVGALPLGDRAAIYLIFPTNGLLESHCMAIRHIIASGYAPVVVSNQPLTEAERAELTQISALVIERHNFGYDFGGYRDAVLALGDRLPTLRHLAILNDSAWFPLPTAGDWLHKAESMDLDLVGAASHRGMCTYDFGKFREITWTYTTRDRTFHYTSYAMSISGKVLKEPDFLKFWQQFPLTNHKSWTVRRGEIGLTRWIMDHEYTHGSVLNVQELDSELAAMSDAQIQRIAQKLIVLNIKPLQVLKKQVLTLDGPSRADLTALILNCVAGVGAGYVLAEHLIFDRGFDFFKKSPLWMSPEDSQISLDIAARIPGDTGAIILREARELARTRLRPPAEKTRAARSG